MARLRKAIIWTSVTDLAEAIKLDRSRNLWTWRVVVTSGGFDPLHLGHVRCIQESTKLGECVVVIVNGDGFLLRKKGYSFMPQDERVDIIASLSGVDHVLLWDDGTQFVDGALAILRPDVFAKGGDRSDPAALAQAELAVCKEIGCNIAYGVGGREKLQSSSILCARLRSMNGQERE